VRDPDIDPFAVEIFAGLSMPHRFLSERGTPYSPAGFDLFSADAPIAGFVVSLRCQEWYRPAAAYPRNIAFL
jgi:hypothetical protein